MYIGSVVYIYIYLNILSYMSMPMTHRLASGTQGRESCRRHRPGTGGAKILGKCPEDGDMYCNRKNEGMNLYV